MKDSPSLAELLAGRLWTPSELAARFGGVALRHAVRGPDAAALAARLAAGAAAHTLMVLPADGQNPEPRLPPAAAFAVLDPAGARRAERARLDAREDEFAAALAAEERDPTTWQDLRAGVEALLPSGFIAREIPIGPSTRGCRWRHTMSYNSQIEGQGAYIHLGGLRGDTRATAWRGLLPFARRLALIASLRIIGVEVEHEALLFGAIAISFEGRELLLYLPAGPTEVKFADQRHDIYEEIYDFGLGGEPWILDPEVVASPEALRTALAAIPPGGLAPPADWDYRGPRDRQT